MRNIGRLLAAAFLFTSILACSPSASQTNSYLLRSEPVDLPAATSHFQEILAVELRKADLLASPYPLAGSITTTPDPANPNIELMRCTAGQPEDSQGVTCLLVNSSGDFVRLTPITWQSAAFYMYRVYVLPHSLFARVDPAKDFIAIDVFTLQDPSLWDVVAQSIHQAAQELGAEPYQP